jgi:hypothetical protein
MRSLMRGSLIVLLLNVLSVRSRSILDAETTKTSREARERSGAVVDGMPRRTPESVHCASPR